jgi:hypothetical protein
MEDARVIKLYESSPTCLDVTDVQNMVGRVPLIPLFLADNLTPTIPHMFSKSKDSGFMAVPTLLQRKDGGAAISMRSTCGCGSLGVASPAWEA